MKKEVMPRNRGDRKVNHLFKNHSINHLINNIHWDIFEQMLEITKSTPTQFLEWLERLPLDYYNPCLTFQYINRFLFFSRHNVDNVQIASMHKWHIWIPKNFIGIGITIEDTWDLYRANGAFRIALTKKYWEKYRP